jgi:hypothetical protein
MTRPQQHIIDQKAQRLFQSSLPPSWEIRSRNPDYRIDYAVEIFEQSQSTGLEFAVQLKGTEKPLITNKTVRFSVETEHLAYWMDKTRHPVFLVVIDVVKAKGWWFFVQQAVREGTIKRSWRTQTTVTIKIPIANTLTDISLLRKAVADAVPYMSSLWPGAVLPSIQAEKARLEELDPRWNVQINATHDKLDYVITPKDKPVDLHYTFHAADQDDLQKNIIGPLERGEPVMLTPAMLIISGSKLFEQGLKNPVSVQFQRLADAEVKLRIVDGEYIFDSLTAKLKGGMKNIYVSCDVAGGLLTISFESVPPGEREGPQPMSFCLRLNHYYEKEILKLPYFDQILRMVTALAEAKPLAFEFWKDGERKANIPIRLDDPSFFRTLCNSLRFVQRARNIARLLNLSPKLPPDIRRFPSDDIEHLHSLMTGEELRLPGDRYAVSTVATNGHELTEGAMLENIRFPIALKQFRVYDVETTLQVQITLPLVVIEKVEPRSDPGLSTVVCKGAAGTEMVLRRHTDTEGVSTRS